MKKQSGTSPLEKTVGGNGGGPQRIRLEVSREYLGDGQVPMMCHLTLESGGREEPDGYGIHRATFVILGKIDSLLPEDEVYFAQHPKAPWRYRPVTEDELEDTEAASTTDVCVKGPKGGSTGRTFLQRMVSQ